MIEEKAFFCNATPAVQPGVQISNLETDCQRGIGVAQTAVIMKKKNTNIRQMFAHILFSATESKKPKKGNLNLESKHSRTNPKNRKRKFVKWNLD